ncbi:MAG: hypothetical protein ACREJO_10850 [Phycisphaerales bacterium]
MSLPLAYFLTWTCYGQRLHGDERGSVDGDHNIRGTPVLARDTARQARERASMKDDAILLDRIGCPLVDEAIVQLCAERRWLLLARSVRPTHVHVVVNCRGAIRPERALAQFKARGTVALRREGLASQDARLWTRHGSTRWINHSSGLYRAIVYVNEWQSGTNRAVLEEHKQRVRAQIEELKRWLRSQGLPEDGRTVVVGESSQERAARLTCSELSRRE